MPVDGRNLFGERFPPNSNKLFQTGLQMKMEVSNVDRIEDRRIMAVN